MLRALAGALDLADQIAQIARIRDKIDRGRLDHQQRGLVVVEEKIPVRRRDAFEVFQADIALKIAIALAQAFGQHVDPRRHEDHQIRLHHPLVEQAINVVVERQFVGRQILRREDPILGEEIIRDRGLCEEILLGERALLIIARQEKVELDRECVLVRIFVKAREKRVPLDLPEHQPSIELRRKQAGEAGFADPDRTLDRDIGARHFILTARRGLRRTPCSLTLRLQIGAHNVTPGWSSLCNCGSGAQGSSAGRGSGKRIRSSLSFISSTVAPRSAKAPMISSTSHSGDDALAVSPRARTPSIIAGSTSAIESTRNARAPRILATSTSRFAFELCFEPTTRIASLTCTSSLTAFWRFWVA